jgi:predicted aspartyl protease
MTVSDLNLTREQSVDALVDTGASCAASPASALRDLAISPVERRRFGLADGRSVEYDIGFALVGVDSYLL